MQVAAPRRVVGVVSTPDESYAPPEAPHWRDTLPAAFLSSSRQIKLHSYDPVDQDGYRETKIGGHALDHVPFVDRGLPSRPLMGYSVSPTLQKPSQTPSHPSSVSSLMPVALLCPTLQPACSHCTSVQETTAKIQLCCGHKVCGSCLESGRAALVELQDTHYVDCSPCHSLVKVDTISVHSNTFPLYGRNSNHLSSLNMPSKMQWGLSGGLVALLSFAAGRYISARRIVQHQALLQSPPTTSNLSDLKDCELSSVERWSARLDFAQANSRLHQYHFLRSLGKGQSGEVMLVRTKKTEKVRVIKESDKVVEAINECRLLAKVDSPHVVRLYHYFIETMGMHHLAYIELEYCAGGDLQTHLQSKGKMDATTFQEALYQLCMGLQALHDLGIIHRDLKPANILLSANGDVKIADLDVSTSLDSTLMTRHAAGTLSFMAPEVRKYLFGDPVEYDAKADVWSLGALVVAMLLGQVEPKVATRPVSDVVVQLAEANVQQEHIDLVEKMLQADPTERPSVHELIQMLPIQARL